MAQIVLSGQATASDTDLLNGTRLQTVPSGGVMLFEFESDLADATNNFTVSIQLPDGETPVESVLVPASSAGTAGVLNEREKLSLAYPIAQGGHVVVSFAETGAAVLTYRITFQS